MPAFPRPFGTAEGWLWLLCRPVANLTVFGLIFGQMARPSGCDLPAARVGREAECERFVHRPEVLDQDRRRAARQQKTPAKPAF
jgi:hypothetical protein